nr:diguanylate cyclase [Desulfovibrio inopinatus]
MSRPRKILIIDDSTSSIRILGTALRGLYDVLVATNGEKGLEVAAAQSPDLILLDIMMPGINGYEVCRRLKEDPHLSSIPVIFITAKDDEEDEEQGLNLGAVDYITKPFRLPIVLARVRTHLRLKEKSDLLERLASVDGLTDIPNRRRFDEVLDMEFQRARRDGTPLGVILIDIDFFKHFNDTYGHAAGDECLRRVARVLSRSLKRPADFVARYGGEEFVAVVPGTPLDGTMALADAMRQSVFEEHIPHAASTAADFVTISLGAESLVPHSTDSSEQLLKNADEALYLAKQNGRNQVQTLAAQTPPKES